jgi:5'-nucleotidase
VSELGELREARLAHWGSVRVRVDHVSDEDVDLLHTHEAELAGELEPDTDTALLAAGHPTLTELQSVTDRPGLLSDGSLGRRAS